VHELTQLYNSLDPVPFWDPDLDRNAVDFIEGKFREHLAADSWHLNVHVQNGEADAQTLQAALETPTMSAWRRQRAASSKSTFVVRASVCSQVSPSLVCLWGYGRCSGRPCGTCRPSSMKDS
jgi:hypothetical protein